MARAKRREAEVSRAEILEVAEKHLAAGGPSAVKVQTVAAALGLTDAAVHYHFGNRRGLMQALLRQAGRNLKASLADASGAAGAPLDFAKIVDRLDDGYRRRDYARLALWLALEEETPPGEGMYRPLAEAVHRARRGQVPFEDTQIAVALLNVVLIGEALAGEAIMAGVGLPGNEKARGRLRAMARDLIARHLDLAPAKRGPRGVARPR
jgi:TetR/AcrR family transcriptional regulator, repressor for neighboring sulfatase